jgi:hypothetical protein
MVFYLAKNIIFFFFLLHIHFETSIVLFMPYVTGCYEEVT